MQRNQISPFGVLVHRVNLTSEEGKESIYPRASVPLLNESARSSLRRRAVTKLRVSSGANTIFFSHIPFKWRTDFKWGKDVTERYAIEQSKEEIGRVPFVFTVLLLHGDASSKCLLWKHVPGFLTNERQIEQEGCAEIGKKKRRKSS